jgi:hypothetical protein
MIPNKCCNRTTLVKTLHEPTTQTPLPKPLTTGTVLDASTLSGTCWNKPTTKLSDSILDGHFEIKDQQVRIDLKPTREVPIDANQRCGGWYIHPL